MQTEFISPHHLETLNNNKLPVDTFTVISNTHGTHSLAKRADLVVVAPATAQCAAKLANGIADDMLTTTVLACRCKSSCAA